MCSNYPKCFNFVFKFVNFSISLNRILTRVCVCPINLFKARRPLRISCYFLNNSTFNCKQQQVFFKVLLNYSIPYTDKHLNKYQCRFCKINYRKIINNNIIIIRRIIRKKYKYHQNMW